MVIQWDLMGFNGIHDGIASGKLPFCELETHHAMENSLLIPSGKLT